MRRHHKRSKFRRNRTSILDPRSPKLYLGAEGGPSETTGIPREPKGSQNENKEGALGAKGAPKGPTSIPREPKRGQGHPKESKSSLLPFKGQQQSTKLYTLNKIYSNSRSTALQRPSRIMYDMWCMSTTLCLPLPLSLFIFTYIYIHKQYIHNHLCMLYIPLYIHICMYISRA